MLMRLKRARGSHSEEMADLVKSLNGNVNMRVDSNYSDYVIIAGPGMEDMAKV